MAKVTLSDLSSLNNQNSAVTTINNNNTRIEQGFENTLSRDGASPNEMNTTLDMNSHRIINLPIAADNHEPLTLGQADTLIDDAINELAEELARLNTGPNTFDYRASIDGPREDFDSTPTGTMWLDDISEPQVFYTRFGDPGNWLGPYTWAFTDADIADIMAVIRPQDYGTVDGVDDTTAFLAAFAAANALVREGATPQTWHPGAVVDLGNTEYILDSLNSFVPVKCNVRHNGAKVVVPALYDGEAFRIGYDSGGNLLATADIDLPDITRDGETTVADSIGVRVVNINASRIKLRRIDYFEKPRYFGGIGQGTVYNDIWLGMSNSGDYSIYIVPGTSGWCNRNNFYGGNLFIPGTDVAGRIQFYADGSISGNTIVGNNFIGLALEGVPEKLMYCKWFYRNNFIGCYHESGLAFSSVTCSGDTWTRSNHGFSVGDMVSFKSVDMPTGTVEGSPYFVVDVPNANTFKISTARGGTAITASDAGSGITVSRMLKAEFDGTSSNTSSNHLDFWTPTSVYIDVVETGQARDCTVDTNLSIIKRPFIPIDFPIYRTANTGFGAYRPLYAAYGPSINPHDSPDAWSVALSDLGLWFKNTSGSIVGRLLVDFFGNLGFRPNDGSTTYMVMNGFLTDLVAMPGSVSVLANDRLLQTFTVTGAEPGMHVHATPNSALPNGIIVAWAYVSSTNTVTVCLNNVTGSHIDMSNRTFRLMVTRDAV